jgi:glyoxylase-like metal-dependent hydrolase (beta-lactamase superfamily II)
VTSVKVGNVEIVQLLDVSFAFPYSAFFPAVPAEKWPPYQQLYPRSSRDGNFATNAQAYAVRSGGRTVLVDTALGPNPPFGGPGQLLNDMKAKGVDPAAIDTVVFTHLHVDHVGWNLQDGKPVFPRARYMAPEADWTFFTQESQRAQNAHIAAQVEPLQKLGLLDLVSGERTLTPELTIVPTPGHTPGHQSIAVVSAGERAFITGDVAHHPAQVNETEWNSGFDGDPATAAATRKRVMERLEQDGSLAVICHFPAPGYGRIVREGGRRIFRAL